MAYDIEMVESLNGIVMEHNDPELHWVHMATIFFFKPGSLEFSSSF